MPLAGALSPDRAAKDFYAGLRRADAEGADLILAGALSDDGIGRSLMDRMLRAADHTVLDPLEEWTEERLVLAIQKAAGQTV